jgi:hypothetical protein
MADRMTTDNPASGEPLASQPALTAPAPARSAASEDLPRAQNPHAPKFRLVIAVLLGIAAGAISIAVVVVSRGGNNRGAPASGVTWSSWTPDSSGDTGVSEIAQHIAPYYRLSASQQLDVITPIALSQSTAAGTGTGSGLTVAVSEGSGKSQSLGLLNGKTIAYNVCGLGAKDCELAGTPSTSRMLLLRREALQLALFTFKYISGSQNVVVVLPPGHTVTAGGSSGSGTGVTVAVLFVRRELQPWLTLPFTKTLQQYPPELSQLTVWTKTQEAGLVDQITAHGLFSSQVESLQEGGSVLVLSPLPAQ